MDDRMLKIDPAIDVVTPRADTLAFLTPDGPFSMRDRHGLVQRVINGFRDEQSLSGLLRSFDGEGEQAAASELVDLLVNKGVLAPCSRLPRARSADPLRDWIRHQGGVLDDGGLFVEIAGEGLLAQAVRLYLTSAETDAGFGGATAIRVMALDTPDHSRLLTANAAAVASGARFLPAWLNRSTFHLGPSIVPGATACLACLLHRQQAAKWRSEPVEAGLVDGVSVSKSLAQLGASLLFSEIVRMALDAYVHTDFGMAYQFDLLNFRLTAGKVVRLPHCPVCDTAPVSG